MSPGKITTVLVIRPPRSGNVIGAALGMGAELVSVERVAGMERSAFGLYPVQYDRMYIETSERAYRETLEIILEAARSGRGGDGKAFIFRSEAEPGEGEAR
ncbi:MAG: hypothetical protein JW909_10595 [Planctomycetes bacterium]|nr:hypothetical protein [Planctomycetota bacterium]